MSEEQRKTFEDIIMGRKQEVEQEPTIKIRSDRKLSVETIEKEELSKDVKVEKEDNISKNFIEKEKKQESVKSEDFLKEIEKVREEIKTKELEKNQARKNVSKLERIMERLNLEFEGSKYSASKEELQKKTEEAENTMDVFNDLVREYGKSMGKENINKNVILDRMMDQRNLLEKEKLEQEGKNKGTFAKAIDKYNKMPLKYKILITGALVGGGALAGMAGGSAAIAGSLALGSVKVFESIAAGVGAAGVVEGFGKRKEQKIQKEAMAQMKKEYSGGTEDLATIWSDKMAEVDEQIEKNRGRRTIAKWLVGGGVGIGTFLLSGGHKDFANAYKMMRADKVVFGAGESLARKETQQAAEKAGEKAGGEVEKGMAKEVGKVGPMNIAEETVKSAEKVAEKSFEAVAKKGDTVWGLAEKELSEHYGEAFSKLDPARKTYLIDAIKDKMVANPQQFGLTDVNKLAIGQKVDFSSVFQNKNLVQNIFSKAENLTKSQITNIEKNLAQATAKGGKKVVESINRLSPEVKEPVNNLWNMLVGKSEKGFWGENLSKIGEGKSFFAKQEWDTWKNMDVTRILSSSFENEKGVRLLERGHRQSFMRFLKMLRRTVPPLEGKKETVFEYLFRAQAFLK